MLKYLVIALVILSITGCATSPGTMQYTDDGYAVLGEKKNVEIQAEHALPFKRNEAWVDIWYLRIVNNSRRKDWCVGVEWRTLDYTISVPNRWFFVPSHSYANIGSATQRTWDVGNVDIAMPDAGFAVYKVLLKKPNDGYCDES